MLKATEATTAMLSNMAIVIVNNLSVSKAQAYQGSSVPGQTVDSGIGGDADAAL